MDNKSVAPPVTTPSAAVSAVEESPAALLRRLEQRIDVEIGPLREGVEPILDEVRRALNALFPGPAGMQLAPAEQEKERALLRETLDTLEDILEALQLAARGGAHAGRTASRGEG